MSNPAKPTKFYRLKSISTGKQYEEKETCTQCLETGDPLEIEYDYDFLKKRLNFHLLKTAPLSALKYLSLYPITDFSKIVSLKEGATPLINCHNLNKKLGLKNVYVKNEGLNPTGVFKDRGSMVEVTKALELNAKAICLASTGNMAASVAAYSTIAKIPCYVLVPEGTPFAKLAQTMAYGARILQIRGGYSECATLAKTVADKYGFYLAGDYAFRAEGQKSQGYEIVEQLLWKVPDYVICPIGCGTNLSAIWKGFTDFYKLGLINRLPKLIGVQTDNCQVIVKAFKKHKRTFDAQKKVETVCSAIAASNPLDGKKVLKALYASKGTAVSVADEEALAAGMKLSNQEAIFVEPTGALGLAALEKLNQKKFFNKNDTVVIVATGNGLKDSNYVLKTLPDPPTFEADIAEIDNYLKRKLYRLSTALVSGKEKALWKTAPTKARLKQTLKYEFNIEFDNKSLIEIEKQVKSFFDKGRQVTKPNLKSIIEEAINQVDLNRIILKVVDFKTSTSLKEKAQAEIKILYAKKEITAKANGVGAVDALITALKRAIKDIDTMFVQLTDYNVSIDSAGIDAVVKIYMTLKDKAGNTVRSTASSPDVIVASVKAFEKGYNILYNQNLNQSL